MNLNRGEASAELLRGAGIAFFGNLAGRSLGLLYHFLLARFLGPREYGVFLLGLGVFSFASLLADLGLRGGILRDAAVAVGRGDRGAIKATIRGGGLLALGASLMGAVGLVAITPWVASSFKAPELDWILPLFALALPFATLGAIFLGALQAFRKVVALSVVQFLLDALLRIVAFLGLVLLARPLFAAAVSHLLAAVVIALVAFLALRSALPLLVPALSGHFRPGRLLAYSFPLLMANFVGFILQWADTLLVGYYLAAWEVGLYGAAGRLAGLSGIFLAAASTIFAPKIFALYGQREVAEVGRLYQHSTRWILIFVVPLFLYTIVHAEALLSLFGTDFVKGAPALYILAAATLLMTGTGPAGDVVLMVGKSKVVLYVSMLFGALGLGLNVYLIPRLGLVGAALATGLTIASSNVTNVLMAWRFTGFQPYTRAIAKPILLACAVAGVQVLIGPLIGGSHLTRLLGGAAIWLLYPVLLWRLALQAEDLEVWRFIKGSKGCAGSSGS